MAFPGNELPAAFDGGIKTNIRKHSPGKPLYYGKQCVQDSDEGKMSVGNRIINRYREQSQAKE